MAARMEEQRLVELKKHQQYQNPPKPQNSSDSRGNKKPLPNTNATTGKRSDGKSIQQKCYICGDPGHVARDCSQKKSESKGKSFQTSKSPWSNGNSWRARQVKSKKREWSSAQAIHENPLDFLVSDSESDTGEVNLVRVADKGSIPQGANIFLQGIPAVGVVDSGEDITIVGGELFKQVAAAAQLWKRDFQPPDKTPRTYDQKPFRLDGKMDLDITFADRTMRTPVYVKMDAHEPLLLSEGVCRQLGKITYHQDVVPLKGSSRKKPPEQQKRMESIAEAKREEIDAVVPTVWVSLVRAVALLPH